MSTTDQITLSAQLDTVRERIDHCYRLSGSLTEIVFGPEPAATADEKLSSNGLMSRPQPMLNLLDVVEKRLERLCNNI